MKFGFLFAGQGQQFYCMGQDLALKYPEAKLIYDQAEKILGYNVLELSAEQLKETLYTQPALYTLGYILDTLLKKNNIIPSIVSGLSLGEYNALSSASALEFDDGLALIAKRAEIMQNAFEPYSTGMAACLKTNRADIAKILQGTNIEICNVNTLSQIVIGGRVAELQEVIQKLKKEKILAIPLKVSTVSHMSLMSEASALLQKALSEVKFKAPNIPFINNLSGDYQSDLFHNSLAQHISQTTELASAILRMKKDGITNFIEVGPKGSISKFVKELCGAEVEIVNVYDVASLEGVING
ncbi:MAG: ACP S-malonyltransferase [Erysipelotrichaceae bacterium]